MSLDHNFICDKCQFSTRIKSTFDKHNKTCNKQENKNIVNNNLNEIKIFNEENDNIKNDVKILNEDKQDIKKDVKDVKTDIKPIIPEYKKKGVTAYFEEPELNENEEIEEKKKIPKKKLNKKIKNLEKEIKTMKRRMMIEIKNPGGVLNNSPYGKYSENRKAQELVRTPAGFLQNEDSLFKKIMNYGKKYIPIIGGSVLFFILTGNKNNKSLPLNNNSGLSIFQQ